MSPEDQDVGDQAQHPHISRSIHDLPLRVQHLRRSVHGCRVELDILLEVLFLLVVELVEDDSLGQHTPEVTQFVFVIDFDDVLWFQVQMVDFDRVDLVQPVTDVPKNAKTLTLAEVPSVNLIEESRRA